MPHSSSEQSLVTNFHPVLMGNSDISVKDELGHSNPLEVGEYTSRNGELVNLENACVNIDNSSDVIIGPVTQFNVNGNVTIYQNENGQQRTADEEGCAKDTAVPHDEEVSYKPSVSTPLDSLFMVCTNQSKKQVVFITIAFLLTTATPILYITLSMFQAKKAAQSHESCWSQTHIGKHRLYSRQEWNAGKPMRAIALPLPTDLVIISHSATDPCNSFKTCSKQVQNFQFEHMLHLGLADICYNFIIGGDGNIFLGRGWDTVNCHKQLSIGINLIGNFEFQTPNHTMIDSLRLLIKGGVIMGKISKDYILIGHNQTYPTDSPGKNVYKLIKTFSHFSDINFRK